jgi:UDP-N-acetylmuramyl pentapeptide phosphotransferase/UDP-N-acetylglucosamine-1-phosphate transferase
VTVVLAGLLVFGGVRAWRNRRMTLSIAVAVALLAQLIFTFKLYSDQAQQFIIFGGDAGCFVLGSVLMATFYIRRQSIIYENSLRWAFLIIGSLAFMDAFAVWTGGIERIPFGENENGLSDPSVLTELYGWNVNLLRTRYQRLAMLCLAALTTLYACGLAIVAREGKTSQRDRGLDYS